MTAPRPGTHCARVLDALADGKPHTTRQLYREVGPCILHSRVADLRRKGYNITCEHIDGKGNGAGAYRYTWIDAPAQIANLEETPSGQFTISTDEIAPRVPEERYRCFRVKNGGPPEIVGTAATRAEMGEAVFQWGEEGMFEDYCIGLQDALDHQDANGKWVGKWYVKPWQKGM